MSERQRHTSPRPGRRDRHPRRSAKAMQGTPRAGSACPVCRRGTLEYDGCLNLVCPVCGYISTGAFT
ncbi:MAG: hypothetical protein AB1449_04775 [Chloroflexota bacterium]